MIPRFITEVVAFSYSEKHQAYVPVCNIFDVEQGETFMYGVVKGFNFFGTIIFARLEGELFNLTWSQVSDHQRSMK